MIITQNLSKQFGDFLAVDGITLQVKAGEVLVLLGPNGAGKTTTVRMLTSVLTPTRGWARIAGFDVASQADKVRAAVGVLTEQHGLYLRMPSREYLDFFGQLYCLDEATRRRRVEQLFNQFGLTEISTRRIGELSKGMRQKLALARALLHDPTVLLLDEPTSAMDPESARLVRDSIRELRSADRTIVICTHNLAEAEQLADTIAIIRHGKVIAKGSPTELKNNLLGPSEYEVRFGSQFNGRNFELPPGVALTSQGNAWLRFQTSFPDQANPDMLRALLSQDFPVVSLQEVERSLEQVYLRAINLPEDPSPDGELANVE